MSNQTLAKRKDPTVHGEGLETTLKITKEIRARQFEENGVC